MTWIRSLDRRAFHYKGIFLFWRLIIIFIVIVSIQTIKSNTANAQESQPQIYGVPPVPGNKLSDLSAWVGYEPDFLDAGTNKDGSDNISDLPQSKQIWANVELHSYLIKLLGESKYNTVVNDLVDTSLVEKMGTWIEISRCMPHNCPDTATIFIDPKDDDVKVYLTNFSGAMNDSIEWLDYGVDEKAMPSSALSGWDLTNGSDPTVSFQDTAEDYLKSNPGLSGSAFQKWIDSQMSAIEVETAGSSISTCGQLLSYGGNLTDVQIIDIKNEIAQALQYANGLAQQQGLPMLSDENYQNIFVTINNTIPNTFVKDPNLESQLLSDVESWCANPGVQGDDIQRIVATDYNTIRMLANMPQVALGF